MWFSYIRSKRSSNPESNLVSFGVALFAVARCKQAVRIPVGMQYCASDLSLILSVFSSMDTESMIPSPHFESWFFPTSAHDASSSIMIISPESMKAFATESLRCFDHSLDASSPSRGSKWDEDCFQKVKSRKGTIDKWALNSINPPSPSASISSISSIFSCIFSSYVFS